MLVLKRLENVPRGAYGCRDHPRMGLQLITDYSTEVWGICSMVCHERVQLLHYREQRTRSWVKIFITDFAFLILITLSFLIWFDFTPSFVVGAGRSATIKRVLQLNWFHHLWREIRHLWGEDEGEENKCYLKILAEWLCLLSWLGIPILDSDFWEWQNWNSASDLGMPKIFCGKNWKT